VCPGIDEMFLMFSVQKKMVFPMVHSASKVGSKVYITCEATDLGNALKNSLVLFL